MFEEAAKIGGLDVQLVYYRGTDEVRHSSWFSDAHELVSRMSAIRCVAGTTKIARVLRHIRTENEREKVSRGDLHRRCGRGTAAASSTTPRPVWACRCSGSRRATAWRSMSISAANSSVEHPPQTVEQIFRELARLTGGAYGKFDAGAAKQLGELLRAVAAFAVGGLTALADQHTDSARKLLSQMK